MPPSFQRTLPNTLPALGETARQLTAFMEECDASAAAVFAANLALEELVTNIIKYGHNDTDEHPIDVRLDLHPDRFELEIRDDGHPFDPFSLPEPDTTLPITERKIGGLGLHFVRKLLDFTHYERRDGYNIVRVSKHTSL